MPNFPLTIIRNVFGQINSVVVSSILGEIKRVTDEAEAAETAAWPIPFLLNMLTALKRFVIIFDSAQEKWLRSNHPYK